MLYQLFFIHINSFRVSEASSRLWSLNEGKNAQRLGESSQGRQLLSIFEPKARKPFTSNECHHKNEGCYPWRWPSASKILLRHSDGLICMFFFCKESLLCVWFPMVVWTVRCEIHCCSLWRFFFISMIYLNENYFVILYVRNVCENGFKKVYSKWKHFFSLTSPSF